MNSLLINCSHFSPDPLPRTNAVETGGSCFQAALWKFEAEVVYCRCYGFTVMAVRTSGCMEKNGLASIQEKEITESNLSLMHPFLPTQKTPTTKKSSVYNAACSQWRNRDLISRQEEGIHVQNIDTKKLLQILFLVKLCIFIFSSEAGNTLSCWSLCTLSCICTCVSLFTYINKLRDYLHHCTEGI